MNIKEIRKNKGDCTFYLTKDGLEYRLIKKRKAYAKAVIKSGSKTTKIILCDIVFSLSEFDHLDFNSKGLRTLDKDVILSMIKAYENDEAK